jgi:CelD/BcsL family acetyltransferase involved in cellulose biosynthesis/dTDP-4-amino-4,6-dideoxygalactose transaminase
VAIVSGTFVPTYQGLSALDFVRSVRPTRASGFPFDAPSRVSFFRARNAIYHLFRALVERNPALTVLAPDYNSGNEILAMRAAGARLQYYPIDRRMQLDPDDVDRLCARYAPDVLYVIHYIGWPQPMAPLIDLCRRRGMLLVEDCALALLSESDGRPLGSIGDWSVFCLYKTLPLPNGALLVQNGRPISALAGLVLRDAGSASVLGRTAELVVQRLRSRASYAGAALLTLKRGLGRAAGALDVQRANVGDIGFELDEVDLAMSGVSARLLNRLDCTAIRRTRIENYRCVDALLDPVVPRVFSGLPDGACPLFFPILVDDKHAAAQALQRRGVDALEFWNESIESGEEMAQDARFLRSHVLELPIHQDLTPRHLAYMARQVAEVVGPAKHVRASHRTVDVARVEDEPSLARLQPEWNELLRASEANTPFLTWEWLHAWWRHLRAASGLRVLCVRTGGRLIAVAPLMVRRAPPVWLPAYEFLGAGDAGSDYLDAIVRRGYEPDALDALAGAFDADGLALRLDHVLPSSASAQITDRLAGRGWRALRLPGGRCPIIPLAGHTWDSYLATLGSAHRANVRRRVRAAERTFQLRFECVGTDAERRDALAALLAFHERRFRTDGGSTAFHTPALRAFHDEATRSALDHGWLRMYVLRLNDVPAAVMYALSYEGRFSFYQHGFDERYERHSIGLVLMAHTIRAALEEGADTFDLLWGTEPYKWLWAREANELQQIHLFPGHLGGRIQHGAVIARRGLTRVIRRTFTKGSHA